MNDPSHARPTSPNRWLLPALNLVLLGAVASLLVANWYAMRGSRQQLDRLVHTVDLLRWESLTEFEGLGFNALLEGLTRWAPELQKSDRTTTQFAAIEGKMQNITSTMAWLPDGFQQVENAFLQGGAATDDPATNDEIRKWLLIAAQKADPGRAEDLLAKVLSADEVESTTRLRKFAAEELVLADKARAGELLHRILHEESSSGVSPPGGRQLSPHKRKLRRSYFTFVELYAATGHVAIEKTLLQILARQSDDQMTIQTAVEALGQHGTARAAPQLIELYWRPRPGAGAIGTPLLRAKCLDAVVALLGAESADFLREVDAKETDPGIRAKLNEYKKRFRI